MKVYVKRNPADKYNCPLKEGETGNVSDDVGNVLVKAGLAVCLDEPIKAVPKQPTVAKQEPAKAEPPKAEAPKAPAPKPRPTQSKPNPKNKES